MRIGLPRRSSRRRSAQASASAGLVGRGRRFDALLSAFSIALLVICLGLAGGGLAVHSEDTDPPAAPEAAAKPDRYSALIPQDPVRLEIPSLDISAPIVPIQVSSDSVLDPPSNPRDVGWWDQSAEPGSSLGQTVITGHTVHTGGGAMDRLPELAKGAKVDVVTGAGTMRYRVKKTAALSREDVATYAQELFGQDRGEGRLMLVSCTDWNGSFYERNIVSLAKPLGHPVDRT